MHMPAFVPSPRHQAWDAVIVSTGAANRAGVARHRASRVCSTRRSSQGGHRGRRRLNLGRVRRVLPDLPHSPRLTPGEPRASRPPPEPVIERMRVQPPRTQPGDERIAQVLVVERPDKGR